jgi:hypothetical protein
VHYDRLITAAQHLLGITVEVVARPRGGGF